MGMHMGVAGAGCGAGRAVARGWRLLPCALLVLGLTLANVCAAKAAEGASARGASQEKAAVADTSAPDTVLTLFGVKGLFTGASESHEAAPVTRMWLSVLERRMKMGPNAIESNLMPGPVMKQWETLKQRYRSMSAEEKLRNVNGFFNGWRGIEDSRAYNREEYWACPAEFLSTGGGDCEDYAIIKYYALREFGWPVKDLWLVLLSDTTRRSQHAVLAARTGGKIFILDNLSRPGYLIMHNDQYKKMYIPSYAVNDDGVWVFLRAKEAQKTAKKAEGVQAESKAP